MRLPLLMLLLFLVPAASPQNGSVPAKQTLSYSIEWRLITAGKARIDWTALPGRNGGFEARAHVESLGLVSKLFKVEDDYTATYNQAQCVQSIRMDAHEGVRQRETRVTFDTDAKKASYLERDRLKNTTLLAKETETPGCVHDIVGGLFFCAPSTSSRDRPCRSLSATAREP